MLLGTAKHRAEVLVVPLVIEVRKKNGIKIVFVFYLGVLCNVCI